MYNYGDFACGTCFKTFPAGWRARDNHCNATGHSRPDYECDQCERFFDTESARQNHMWATNHFEERCNICPETWPDEEQAKTHEIDEHYYCRECDRGFQSANNIKMHLNSRVHRGTDIQCPFCRRAFATATGVAHHVENGSCPSAAHVNRDELYRFVRSKDPHGVISKKLIGWHGSNQYEATARTWNGDAYECYFCHREFGTLRSLTQHVNSPTHQKKLYHCPGCRQDFVSLAGIINHFESESCGFMRFEKVQQNFGNIIRGNRLIEF